MERSTNKYEAAKKVALWKPINDGEDQFALDCYIDAKDDLNNWCVAKIIAVDHDQHTVTFNFDGWSPNLNQTLKRNSPRMAPFRVQTTGYSGQRGCAFRETWRYNPAHTSKMEKRVQEIIDTEFMCFKSGFECTQFVRGELFVFVDSLLTLSSYTESDDLPQIVSFVAVYFQLILKWYEIFPRFLQDYKEADQVRALHLVDLRAAIASCGPNLTEAFGKCWGKCNRAQSFFRKFPNDYIVEGTFARQDLIHTNGLAMSFTNAFGEMGGYQKVMGLVKASSDELPFSIVATLVSNFESIKDFCEKDFALFFSEQVSQSLKNRLDNLSETTIKEEKTAVLKEIVATIGKFYRIASPDANIDEVLERYELRIAASYLKSPFFAKRIVGMGELKAIFKKIQNSRRYERSHLDLKGMAYCKWLDLKLYSEWIIDEKILEFIFSESPHAELISRSIEILYARCQNKERPLDDFLMDEIWRCCTEKYEDIQRASLHAIQFLAQYLDSPTLSRFSKRVFCLPIQTYDEKRVIFLQQFTTQAITSLRVQAKELSKDEPKAGGNVVTNFFSGKGKKPKYQDPHETIDISGYVDTKVFWNISQQETLPQKVRDQGLASLTKVLSESSNFVPFKNQLTKKHFLEMAFNNLVQNIHVYTSIGFLKALLETFQLEQVGLQKFGGAKQKLTDVSSRQQIIESLLSDNGFKIIIHNIINYQQAAMEGLQSQSDSLDPTLKIYDQKLTSDNWTHREHIDRVIGFLEFIIINSRSINLEFQHLQALFETLVTKAVTEYESQQFFLLLTKENKNSITRERKFLLDERRRGDVFNKIMCNEKILDVSKLHQEGFTCFKMLFLRVNAQLRVLDMKAHQFDDVTAGFTVLNLDELQGFDTLWQIAMLTRDDIVRSQSRNFLVDLFQALKVSSKQKSALTNGFLARCDKINQQLTVSEQGTDNADSFGIQWRLNWLELIKTFISRFDFEQLALEDISRYDKEQHISVAVELSTENKSATIVVNKQQQIWQLIIAISRQFGLRPSEFKIMTKGGPVDERVYAHLISQYVITNINIERIPEQDLDEQNPRRLIAQNTQFISKLNNLLKVLANNEDIAKQIIFLYDALPAHIESKLELKSQIERISGENSLQQWFQTFQWTDTGTQFSINQKMPPLTVYKLVLLRDLIKRPYFGKRLTSVEQVKKRFEFAALFVKQGGFSFLLQLFQAIDKTNLETSTVRSRALLLVLTIIRPFLATTKLLQLVREALNKQQLWQLCRETLHLIQSYVTTLAAQQALPAEQLRAESKRILREETPILDEALSLVRVLVALRVDTVSVLYNFQNIDQTLLTVYTHIDHAQIQASFNSMLLAISAQGDGLEPEKIAKDLGQPPSLFVVRLILQQMIPQALSNTTKTATAANLFTLLNKLLTETQVANHLEDLGPEQQLLQNFDSMIRQRPIIEMTSSSSNEDCVLTGLFAALQSILRTRPDLRDRFEGKNALIMHLLHECLFKRDSKRPLTAKGQPMPPQCKSPGAREHCLHLIRQLALHNNEGVGLSIDYLRETMYSNHMSTFWRTPRRSDWALSAGNKLERSRTGFVGLKNLGNTCYMNSIMQQLYMIPAFRKAMLEVDDNKFGVEPNDQNTLYQIKRIFGGLMELEKMFYNPKRLCGALKNMDGSPIDPTVQQDVDEFFNMLIDRIENLITGTKEEKVMKNLFCGGIANQFISKQCPHVKEREELFMAIQLDVQGRHSLQESLAKYVEGEMLEGDNAYYCEKCEAKRDTLKRTTLKRFPNILFLELKRFEFNFDLMAKIKINELVEFPMELDMTPYSYQHIQRADLQAKMEESNISPEDLTEDETATLNRVLTPDYYQYSLKGVVVHNGTADSGHYYSFIKDREGSECWFEFNDEKVTPFNAADIPAECYGGENEHFEQEMRQYQGDQAMQQIMSVHKMKAKNAYILIYERAQFIDQAKFNDLSDERTEAETPKEFAQLSQRIYEDCRLPQTVSSQIQITPSIHESILEKNRRFWLTKFIFNRPFLESVFEMLKGFQLAADDNYQGARARNLQQVRKADKNDQLEVLKFICTFCLTAAMRASTRPIIPFFVKMVRQALKLNVAFSVWFCETMSNQAIIKEFFVDCAIPDMTRFISGLLKTAMQTLYQHEEQALFNYIKQLERGRLDEFIKETQAKSLVAHRVRPVPSVGESNKDFVYTPSQNCHVYTLDGSAGSSTPELPMLVVVINAFLHYQGSSDLLSRLGQNQQFHSVIAHFAELGTLARLYLLKTGTLGRLLNILFRQTLTPEHEGGVLERSVPLFQINHPTGLFLEPTTGWQDYKLTSAERQHLRDSAMGTFIFVIRAISLLARSTLYQKSQASGSGRPSASAHFIGGDESSPLYRLEKEELDMLVNRHDDKIWWRIGITEYPVCKNAIAKMFAHISYDNADFSSDFIRDLFATISACDDISVKRYERILLSLVQIDDQLQEMRVARVLNAIYDCFRRHTAYWKYCDSIIELTFKLALRCKPFASGLAANKQLYRMFEQYTKENLSMPLNQQKTKIFKAGIINWNTVNGAKSTRRVTEERVATIKDYSKARLASLRDAMDNMTLGAAALNNGTADDSDNDVYGHPFKEGDHVDVKFAKERISGWKNAKVVFVLDEMLKVQYQKTEMWVEMEGNKVAFSGAYTENQKAENHIFYTELFKYCVPGERTGVVTGEPVGSQGGQRGPQPMRYGQ